MFEWTTNQIIASFLPLQLTLFKGGLIAVRIGQGDATVCLSLLSESR